VLFNEFFVLFFRPNNNAIVFVDVLYLQPINELPNIFDVHEQERDDEMVTCRQHAADNIPVIISTVNHLYNKTSVCLSVCLCVNNNNNNIQDNVYGAVIMAEPLQEFTRFI